VIDTAIAVTELGTFIVAGHSRQAIHRDRDQIHVVEFWLADPVMRSLDSLAKLIATLHSGRVNTYAAYVLLSLVVMLIVRMAT